MSPIHGRVPLVLVALACLAGCGGSLDSHDGSGGTGGAVGAGGAAGDAGRDADPCFQIENLPAPPVAGTPCRYSIPLPPCEYIDRAHIGVKVDGVEIPRDPTHVNGWDYTDATLTEVDIHGPSCDALTNGTATAVTIVFKILI